MIYTPYIKARWHSDDTGHHRHRFNELATKGKQWNGKPRLEYVNGRYPPSKTGVKGNDQADRLAGKATLTSGLLLGRAEVLRSLKHCLRAQSQGHHTIYRLEERVVQRELALDDLLWKDGRGPSSVRRTLEPFQRRRSETSERRGGAHIWAFPSA